MQPVAHLLRTGPTLNAFYHVFCIVLFVAICVKLVLSVAINLKR